MKIQTKKRLSPSLLLTGLLVGVVLVLIGGIYIYTQRHKPSATADTKHTISDKTTTDTQQPNTTETSKASDAPNASDNTDTSAVTVKLLEAYQADSGSLIVSTEVERLGSGTCVLTLSNGSSTFTEKADILYQRTFSTCTGFEVSRNAFASAGVWDLSLQVSDMSGKSVATTTGEVIIK